MPEELSNKVLEYIEYLRYVNAMNDVPQSLIIKDKKDLRKKLEEGIQDTEKGNVCTLEEAFEEIERILYGASNWIDKLY